MKLNDLCGKIFGRITVLDRASNAGHHVRWNCVCECGNKTVVYSDALKKGLTKSCGCLRTEILVKRSLTHGHNVNRKSTKEYKAWEGMKDRCYNPKCDRYSRYGGRGLIVCQEWLNSFENFLKYMGKCPKGWTLERKDFDGNYEPENCVWATWQDQVRNKSTNVYLEYGGKRMIMADWSRELRMDNRKLHYLLRYKGKTLEEVVNGQLF